MPEPAHILVVEDEVLAAMAIEDFFSRKGFRASIAADGVEALDRHRGDPADIIVTDLRMPRMDGRRLIRELRTLTPGLPVVVMTGFVTLEPGDDDLTGAHWQPLEVLRKPVSPHKIDEAVRRLLGLA